MKHRKAAFAVFLSFTLRGSAFQQQYPSIVVSPHHAFAGVVKSPLRSSTVDRGCVLQPTLRCTPTPNDAECDGEYAKRRSRSSSTRAFVTASLAASVSLVALPLAASAAATNYADTAISAVLANPADAMLVLISLAILERINDLKNSGNANTS